MKLKSVNQLGPEYGMPEFLSYEKSSFHGHQLGIYIGLQNIETGDFEEISLSVPEEELEQRIKELIENKDIYVITETINQLNEACNGFVKKNVYYLPYYVDGHSVFRPTINNENVSGASNVSYDLSIELLFVFEDCNRYITWDTSTRNISMFSLIQSIEFDDLGIGYLDATDEYEEGYALDFYDEAGHDYVRTFRDIEDLLDCLVSARIIGITMHIDKD